MLVKMRKLELCNLYSCFEVYSSRKHCVASFILTVVQNDCNGFEKTNIGKRHTFCK